MINVVAALVLAGLALPAPKLGQPGGPRPSATDLWNATVAPLLQKDLSSDFESYDAANYLMLPMHEAFQLTSAPAAWKQQFSANFNLWQNDGYPEATNHLNRLQYLYLPSRFLVLCHRYNQTSLIPSGLEDAMFQQVHDLWLTLPAATWNHADFTGIKSRIDYKLALTKPAKTFYQAVVDEEFFIFSIAADMKAIRNMNPTAHADWDPVINQILEYAYNAYSNDSTYTSDGGWLFQKGIWWDHPDFAYAGQPHIIPNMTPIPIQGIAVDSPHLHRMALWLTSLAEAYKPGDPRRAFYHHLKALLSVQFANHIIVAPEGAINFWRTNNYADGTNGVYRYLYATAGGSGYDAYQGSGTATYGWWSFLHDQTTQNYYLGMVYSYPLSADAIATYVGPNTTRSRDPLMVEPAAYTNGFRELVARMAYQQTFMVGQDRIN